MLETFGSESQLQMNLIEPLGLNFSTNELQKHQKLLKCKIRLSQSLQIVFPYYKIEQKSLIDCLLL